MGVQEAFNGLSINLKFPILWRNIRGGYMKCGGFGGGFGGGLHGMWRIWWSWLHDLWMELADLL